MIVTISRDKASPRSVCVWPDFVETEDVKTSKDGVHYVKSVCGEYVIPAIIPADVFKNAFGMIPDSGTVVEMLYEFE